MPAGAALQVAEADRGHQTACSEEMGRVEDPVGRSHLCHEGSVPLGFRPLPAGAATVGDVVVAVALVHGEHGARGIDDCEAERMCTVEQPVVPPGAPDGERRQRPVDFSGEDQVVDLALPAQPALVRRVAPEPILPAFGELQLALEGQIDTPTDDQGRPVPDSPDRRQEVAEEDDVRVRVAEPFGGRKPLGDRERVAHERRAPLVPGDLGHVSRADRGRSVRSALLVAENDDFDVGTERAPAPQGVQLRDRGRPSKRLRDREEREHGRGQCTSGRTAGPAYDWPVRVAFVYPNPRRLLAAQVAAGTAPDTGLLGQNHLADFGIEARTVEPSLRRRERAAGLVHRLTWNARELTLPWELGDAEVAVTPLANVLPLSARLRGRPRVVVLNYGLTTTWARASRLRRRILRASLRACAAVACLGAAQRETVLAQMGVDPEQVRVLPIGVDERYFEPRALPGDGYVLSVGKDLARDYTTLARAAEALDARVVVVSHPRNLVGISFPPGVEVRTGLSWAELRDLYAGAACVVLPLRRPDYAFGTEGSGVTALLEAMASGRAVVAADRPILHDYASPGESCLFVPPEDPAALRETIELVLGNRSLAEGVGARARQLVEERFTSRALAQRLAALLREVAA